MQRTVPIFRIESYEEAKAHYVKWLGFQIDWEFRFEPTFPVYMQISRSPAGGEADASYLPRHGV